MRTRKNTSQGKRETSELMKDSRSSSESPQPPLSSPLGELRASEEQFNAFFDNANVGATQLDPGGRFVAVNDRFCEITGYSREELLSGMTPLDLSHPDDRERDREQLMPFIEGKTSAHHVEKRYLRKDGGVIWVKITGGTVRDIDGRLVRTAGIIEDITGRKNTETELDALRHRLAADLNSMVRLHQISTKFFREADLAALLEESLETAIDITGADMGKVQLFDEVSDTLRLMVHRGFDQRFLNFFAKIGKGRAACGEAARRGERVVVENIKESPIFIGTPELNVMLEAGVKAIQSTPLISRSGRLVGILSTHYRAPCHPDEQKLRLLDVLARQVTDVIEGKQAQEALLESEQRLRDVIDHASALVWLKDPEGRFLMINRYMERELCLSKDQVLGRTVYDLFPEAEASQYDANDRQVLSSGQPMEFEETLEADGKHTYLAKKFPLRNAEGDIYAVCAICTDVTERKAAEQDLRELARTLEERVAQRTAELEQRAAQLSRLNQELTRVEQRERRRLAELLHDGLQQMLVAAKFRVTEARRHVQGNDTLQQNLNHIDQLLTQSIETSRSLTMELSPPVLQELGLVPALGWLADFMETKHDLRVELRAAGNAEPSSLDLRLLLFPVARELLFNVVKHAGVQAVDLVLEREGQSLRLEVNDQGSGFDVSKWKTVSAGSGRCFGLFDVQNRVELAGGKLKVDSAPGRGTRVSVTLPLSFATY